MRAWAPHPPWEPRMEPLIPSWANPGCWRHLCVPFKPGNSRSGIASLHPHPSQLPEEIPGVLAVQYDWGDAAPTRRFSVQSLSDFQIRAMPLSGASQD